MLKYILIAVQLLIIAAVGILLFQIWRKFKSMPEDEIIGEERTKYLIHRLTALSICFAIIIILSTIQIFLRTFGK